MHRLVKFSEEIRGIHFALLLDSCKGYATEKIGRKEEITFTFHNKVDLKEAQRLINGDRPI